jgi:hypothetical protein
MLRGGHFAALEEPELLARHSSVLSQISKIADRLLRYLMGLSEWGTLARHEIER